MTAYKRYIDETSCSTSASKRSRRKNPLRRSLYFLRDISPLADSFRLTAGQIVAASLLVCVGNLITGKIVDASQGQAVFKEVNELYIMIPILFGVKNILEMTMVSRLTTEATLGNLDRFSSTMVKMIVADLALVLYQVMILSLFATTFAIIVLDHSSMDLCKYSLIVSATLVTTSLSSLVLGIIMAVVIFLLHRYRFDLDSVSMAIAIFLGEITTALLFSKVSASIYARMQTSAIYPFPAMLILLVAVLPASYFIARSNEFTRHLVHSGWGSMLVSVAMSSISGHFLHLHAHRFSHTVTFEPIVAGMARNLISLAISKVSTMLHLNGKMGHIVPEVGELPIPFHRVFYNPNGKHHY